MTCRFAEPSTVEGVLVCHNEQVPYGLVPTRYCAHCPHREAGEWVAPAPAPVTPARGPGTELKKLLHSFGIKAGGCSCNSHAAHMDQMGPDWCEANIDTIVGWLREEAEKRKLPFADFAAKILIKRAISKARRG